MKKLVFLLVALCGLWLCSCSQCTDFQADEQPLYFRIADTLGMQKAEVYNPWQKGELLGRYYLVADSTAEVPADGMRLQVPLQRIATTSATHIGYLKALDGLERIVAMATPDWVYNRPLQAVEDIGEDLNLNMEKLLLSRPNALIISAYGQNMQNIERIRQAGIPIIYMVEWREENPLARMEWIRLMGALIGEENKADSVVEEVREAYHHEQAVSQAITERRSIVSGASFRGTWYVPSGSTYMGQLFRDAGADYAYADRQSDGSIPLNMEQALQVFGKADVWVGCNAKTLSELRQIDEKQTWFRAYKTGEVYNSIAGRTKTVQMTSGKRALSTQNISCATCATPSIRRPCRTTNRCSWNGCNNLIAQRKQVLARVDEHDGNQRMADCMPFRRTEKNIIQPVVATGGQY